ncbi:unnamed protein product, partial [Prorocentrum cordatum]
IGQESSGAVPAATLSQGDAATPAAGNPFAGLVAAPPAAATAKAAEESASPPASAAAAATSEEPAAVPAEATPAGGEAAQTAPVKVETREDFWKVQVEAVYRKRNPYKLGEVKGLMEKYKGKEAALYAKVCKRYDLDPKKLYADPKAWESEDKDVKDEDGE